MKEEGEGGRRAHATEADYCYFEGFTNEHCDKYNPCKRN